MFALSTPPSGGVRSNRIRYGYRLRSVCQGNKQTGPVIGIGGYSIAAHNTVQDFSACHLSFIAPSDSVTEGNSRRWCEVAYAGTCSEHLALPNACG